MRNRLQSAALSLMMATALLASGVKAQQVADTTFKPPIPNPAYQAGRGPVIMLDEAHFNFHTADGRYLAFAELLRRDGYVVKASRSRFDKASLKEGQILVIANALAERNQSDWSLPTPSAFSDEEVGAVRDWVNEGGSLLLIADHMPFPGAADKLASAFGVRFNNGYAIDEQAQGPIVFKLSDGSLKEHEITRGRTDAEKIDRVATFTGSAFQVDREAQPLLVLGPTVVSFMTSVAGQIDEATPRTPVKGWYQGAVMRRGKGRVAVFGEAAMFSAQLAGPNRNPMGMNAPVAEKNPQFLLNLMHWLSGEIGSGKK
ncbi:MAG TPA: DUF4350 domain-containing protein [Blastocatellia bacterium]|nr:DUF4350 domain-containing protein [Blastocatellia bacterium]